MKSLEIQAHGKINLALDIVGKYDNGYHAVDMIMQKINLHDTLICKKNKKDIIINCDHKDVPLDESNLISKGIQGVKSYLGVDYGLEITLEKNIPVSAGLGGGSSDAASAIKAYNSLYELGLTKEEMQKIGQSVGADVPFFFEGDCCRAKGIGEKLRVIKGLDQGWIVLCKPNISVSTKAVYQGLNYPLILAHPDVDAMEQAIEEKSLEKVSKYLGNVLEQVTLKRYSSVREIKEKLIQSEALGVLMSGSGPTVFGIFKDYDSGNKVYKKLSNIYSETYLTRSFNGGNYE
jgi:4-diphosphocytidyl-2-C-methyl-D-erythritol kinase